MEIPVAEWLNSDDKLVSIISNINSGEKSFIEQATEAFNKISEVYKLPKFPDDITKNLLNEYQERGVENPRSVYEEIGIIRFLQPNDDPRGIVLAALYNVKNTQYIDIDICAAEFFGSFENIPDEYVIYYEGEGAECKLCFLKKGERWAKPGIKYASKIIS